MAGLALFATACTGGDSGSGGKGPGGGSDVSGKGKAADAAYKQRKCLRDHGLEVQEPKTGEDANSMRIVGNADSEKMEKAFKECQRGGPNAGQKGPSQADKDKILKIARCVREHGFNMPDPKFDGSAIQNAPKIPPGQQKQFGKAFKECQNAG
ncbi:hypothetical protein [Streptomyces sp. NPDC048637]|uniref:hypothetical protein n=1 Tax=Streptomyces sp. NPDC048637 TaxID=3155636 RepID=UPI0034432C33